MRDQFKCPVCDMHRSEPMWASVATAPWGACACSDITVCVHHQFAGSARPTRPPEGVLVAKAQEIMDWTRDRFGRQKARAEEYLRMRELDWATGD